MKFNQIVIAVTDKLHKVTKTTIHKVQIFLCNVL